MDTKEEAAQEIVDWQGVELPSPEPSDPEASPTERKFIEIGEDDDRLATIPEDESTEGSLDELRALVELRGVPEYPDVPAGEAPLAAADSVGDFLDDLDEEDKAESVKKRSFEDIELIEMTPISKPKDEERPVSVSYKPSRGPSTPAVVTSIVVLLLTACGACMIVIGALYFLDCPRMSTLPVYLIVSGALCILKSVTLISMCCYRCSCWDLWPFRLSVESAEGLLDMFLLAWFIAGAVWVYYSLTHVQFKTPGETDYCHPVLLWVSVGFSVAGQVFLLMCFLVKCAAGCLRKRLLKQT